MKNFEAGPMPRLRRRMLRDSVIVFTSSGALAFFFFGAGAAIGFFSAAWAAELHFLSLTYGVEKLFLFRSKRGVFRKGMWGLVMAVRWFLLAAALYAIIRLFPGRGLAVAFGVAEALCLFAYEAFAAERGLKALTENGAKVL